MKNGPLEDKEKFEKFFDRQAEFATYAGETQKMLSEKLWGIPKDEQVDAFSSLDELKKWTKSVFADIHATHECLGQINTANLENLARLSKISSTEIMEEIENNDKAHQTGLILKSLERFSEPVVLLDHSLSFTPLR